MHFQDVRRLKLAPQAPVAQRKFTFEAAPPVVRQPSMDYLNKRRTVNQQSLLRDRLDRAERRGGMAASVPTVLRPSPHGGPVQVQRAWLRDAEMKAAAPTEFLTASTAARAAAEREMAAMEVGISAVEAKLARVAMETASEVDVARATVSAGVEASSAKATSRLPPRSLEIGSDPDSKATEVAFASDDSDADTVEGFDGVPVAPQATFGLQPTTSIKPWSSPRASRLPLQHAKEPDRATRWVRRTVGKTARVLDAVANPFKTAFRAPQYTSVAGAPAPTRGQPAAAMAAFAVSPSARPVVGGAAHGTDAARCLSDFLNGGELEMSAHVQRMAALITSLEWHLDEARSPAGPLGRSPSKGWFTRKRDMQQRLSATLSSDELSTGGITAEVIYDSVAHSVDVFEQLRTERDRFNTSQRTLLKTLRQRQERYAPLRTSVVPGTVVVLGGGPIGMRAAVEMALLGHSVSVLESRDTCSRLNVLKLWEETTIDLDSLGLKSIDADYANKKTARASTARLQLSLLKAALLLGVRVHVGGEHEDFGLEALPERVDALFIATGFRHALYDKLRAQATVVTFSRGAVPGASAEPLAHEQHGSGFQPTPEGRAPSAALAVVAHFECKAKCDQTKQWCKAYQAFDWTVQDAKGADDPSRLKDMQKRFGSYCIAPKVLKAEGIALENIITYSNKGLAPFTSVPPSYYFIYTLRAEMVTMSRDDPNAKWKLIKMAEGAPATGGSRELLDWAKSRAAKQAGGGVDQEELDRFVKRVVHLFTAGYQQTEAAVKSSLPEACELLRDTTPGFHRSVDLFDFSERKSMQLAAEVITAIDGKRRPEGHPLLVLPVGDALQEPFWPEGLGINRGMHNALDACWTAHQWSGARGDAAQQALLIEQRQGLYESKTQQMHGKSRSMLQGYNPDNSKGTSPKPAYEYTPNPASRYNAPLYGSLLSARRASAEDVQVKRPSRVSATL